MARLIRTEKEVEGRFTEQWIVVEEDALDQWPAGPRTVVGQPAARVDGVERATGAAVYTADVQLPGMLHAAVLRSPHARARVKRLDLTRALEAHGVRGAITAEHTPCLTSSAVGSGFAATSAAAETICPGVQKPHWSASVRTKAPTSGCSRRPSIVVTSRSPTVWTSVMHESTGMPSSMTVQAPQ